MKVVGYASPGQLAILEEPTSGGLCMMVRATANERFHVPVALALEPLEGVSMNHGDGWWDDDGNIYTQPIDVGPWGARIEVHGHSIDEARMLAFRVLEGLT